ncbi:hypothetical protein [Halobacillus salinus]|uniref:hypothetical protein n=1 Tax=Halobacillus salinus TaxID=192814 RepID=UPI0009A7E517|nr:hypothetical protein [Halobacillus salinus]
MTSEKELKEDLKRVYLLSYAISQHEQKAKKITAKVFHNIIDEETPSPVAVYQHTIRLSVHHEMYRDNPSEPLWRLPWSYRAELVLRYNCGLSLEEIASVMKEPVVQMEGILIRAEEQLLEQLEGATVEEEMQRWDRYCDDKKVLELTKRFNKKVKGTGLRKNIYSAIGALIPLFVLVSQYFSEYHVEEEPIHEVIYEELLDEGYTDIQVGSNKEQKEVNIRVVGSTETYKRLHHQLKRTANKILDAESYDDYEVEVESVAVEFKVSGVND